MNALRYILVIGLLLIIPAVPAWASFQMGVPKIDNQLEQKSKLVPCVKALLNEVALPSGSRLEKSAQGTLTVEDNQDVKVYFNVILKTTTGKKGDPPMYLRFVKVEQIDIRKVLEYAKSGDQIYIEQYSTNAKDRLICAPSSITVT